MRKDVYLIPFRTKAINRKQDFPPLCKQLWLLANRHLKTTVQLTHIWSWQYKDHDVLSTSYTDGATITWSKSWPWVPYTQVRRKSNKRIRNYGTTQNISKLQATTHSKLATIPSWCGTRLNLVSHEMGNRLMRQSEEIWWHVIHEPYWCTLSSTWHQLASRRTWHPIRPAQNSNQGLQWPFKDISTVSYTHLTLPTSAIV